MVVIDGDRLPRVPMNETAVALSRLPDAATAVLGASNAVHAEGLVDAAQRAGVTLVGVPRGEGIEPFLDLVRSRFAGGG